MDLKLEQSKSLKYHLSKALKYHFDNFKKLEKDACPTDELFKTWEQNPNKDLYFYAQTHIILELQAYINQLRRLKFYLKNRKISKPTALELIEIW
jgi:hypothetical protein